MPDYLTQYRRTRHPGYIPGVKPITGKKLSDYGTLQVWFDFADISTLFKDTAGTNPVTADGDAIARINDKSGKGYNATQATAGNRPAYKANTRNGNSVGGFSSHALATATFSPTVSIPYDMFVVMRVGAFHNYENNIDSLSANTLLIALDATGIRMYNGANLYVGATANVWFTLRATFNNASSSYQLNGNSPGSGSIGTGSTTLNGFTMGAQAGGTSFPFIGDLGELICYTSTLSTANRDAVMDILRQKWATW